MKTVQTVPTINANDEFVVVVRWHAAEGARVAKGVPLVDVETTKAVVTVEAEAEGWLRHRARENTEIAVGAELAWFFPEESELSAAGSGDATAVPATLVSPASLVAPASKPLASVVPEVAGEFSVTRLTPAAEKLSASLGLAPATLAGEKLGLVTSARLRALLAPPTVTPSPTNDGLRRERDVPAKRAEIQALTEGAEGNLRSSLTVYFDSAGVRARAEADGGGLLPLVLAELAPLLAAHPRFTAFYEAGRIAYYDAVHLGVAIDLGQGLRVVTVRDATTLDAAKIGQRLADLTLDYMENKLAPSDVQGATFTVTDLSAFDVLQFEPLINGRQSAILGLGGDATLPGHPMSLTVAFDHRVLNGREVAAFLQALRDQILMHATSECEEVAEVGVPPLSSLCCDRCQIDVASYYRKFGGVGVMHHYVRPDGNTGLICHSCLLSF